MKELVNVTKSIFKAMTMFCTCLVLTAIIMFGLHLGGVIDIRDAERNIASVLTSHAAEMDKAETKKAEEKAERERNRKHQEWVESEYERRLENINNEYDKKLNELNDWVASHR